MVKEEILNQMKNCVLTMLRNGELLRQNDHFRNQWNVEVTNLKKNLSSCNSCDADWIGNEYAKWMKEDVEIQKSLQDRKQILEDKDFLNRIKGLTNRM